MMPRDDFSALNHTDVQANIKIGRDINGQISWWLGRWLDRYGPLDLTPGLVHSLADVVPTTSKTVERHLPTLVAAPLSPKTPFTHDEIGNGNELRRVIRWKTSEEWERDQAYLVELGVLPTPEEPEENAQLPKKSRTRRRTGGGDA